jgi:hypothetical protein
LVREVEREWQAVFSRRLGYEIVEQRQDDGSEVRLTVSRGDFVGQVDLCCTGSSSAGARRTNQEDPPNESALVIRMVASADSREVSAARAAGRRAIQRASIFATCVGGLLSLGFCWMTIGVESAPLIVGLMLTVIIGSLVLGGHTLGVRVGEDLADRYQLRAERRLEQDAGLQADLKRWNSLGRQLRWHRRALARGLDGTPFRRG